MVPSGWETELYWGWWRITVSTLSFICGLRTAHSSSASSSLGSPLCELSGQLGAVFLICVSLSDAFFPVLCFWYSLPFLVTCQSIFTWATFKLNITNTCSQPCCRPSPSGSLYNLPGTYTSQLLTQVWPPLWALSDGQWLTCHLASCYQLWSGCWAESPTEQSGILLL